MTKLIVRTTILFLRRVHDTPHVVRARSCVNATGTVPVSTLEEMVDLTNPDANVGA